LGGVDSGALRRPESKVIKESFELASKTEGCFYVLLIHINFHWTKTTHCGPDFVSYCISEKF